MSSRRDRTGEPLDDDQQTADVDGQALDVDEHTCEPPGCGWSDRGGQPWPCWACPPAHLR